MTVIVQDDHLSAGAWAACGYINAFKFEILSISKKHTIRIKYRHVVTFSRVRAVVFSLCLMASFVGFLYFLNPRVYFIVRGVFGTLNLIVSSYCYTRISYIIRRYQRELQDSLGDQTTESSPPNMVVYKISVRNTLWIHSTLVTCYLPHLVVSAIMLRSQPSLSILIAQRLTANLPKFLFESNSWLLENQRNSTCGKKNVSKTFCLFF